MHESIEHYCDPVLHHIILINYCRVELKYIRGKNNEVTDTPSILDCNHIEVRPE